MVDFTYWRSFRVSIQGLLRLYPIIVVFSWLAKSPGKTGFRSSDDQGRQFQLVELLRANTLF
jgi:hypothetical protein